ncbi:hypothetical protein K490DRAFT_60833 [Saccharata proteae CBS 121410]|uniref:Uncharacterized protein n=1 Tax=Saccharata proteae CBS 121410 TaxID=1314787 RepID=A0A9P4M305_9PEZI|nr:hypothetical protein K490DRAFT_60833 [Saccharata proteae CBS 121410]
MASTRARRGRRRVSSNTGSSPTKRTKTRANESDDNVQQGASPSERTNAQDDQSNEGVQQGESPDPYGEDDYRRMGATLVELFQKSFDATSNSGSEKESDLGEDPDSDHHSSHEAVQPHDAVMMDNIDAVDHDSVHHNAKEHTTQTSSKHHEASSFEITAEDDAESESSDSDESDYVSENGSGPIFADKVNHPDHSFGKCICGPSTPGELVRGGRNGGTRVPLDQYCTPEWLGYDPYPLPTFIEDEGCWALTHPRITNHPINKPQPGSREYTVPKCDHFSLTEHWPKFQTGRYVERADGHLDDQAIYLRLIVEESRSGERKMSIHEPPPDWEDKREIGRLNRWRYQFRQRKTQYSKGQKRFAWLNEELQLILRIFKRHPAISLPKMTDLINYRFQGVNIGGVLRPTRSLNSVICAIDRRGLRRMVSLGQYDAKSFMTAGEVALMSEEMAAGAYDDDDQRRKDDTCFVADDTKGNPRKDLRRLNHFEDLVAQANNMENHRGDVNTEQRLLFAVRNVLKDFPRYCGNVDSKVKATTPASDITEEVQKNGMGDSTNKRTREDGEESGDESGDNDGEDYGEDGRDDGIGALDEDGDGDDTMAGTEPKRTINRFNCVLYGHGPVEILKGEILSNSIIGKNELDAVLTNMECGLYDGKDKGRCADNNSAVKDDANKRPDHGMEASFRQFASGLTNIKKNHIDILEHKPEVRFLAAARGFLDGRLKCRSTAPL